MSNNVGESLIQVTLGGLEGGFETGDERGGLETGE